MKPTDEESSEVDHDFPPLAEVTLFPISSLCQTSIQDIKLAVQDSSSMEHNRNTCRRSGVPTTPPPSKPAPSPRYNDLTRPSSLLVHKGSRSESNAGGTTSSFFHGTANAVYPGVVRKSTDTTLDSLLPSRDSITVPEGDDETVNAAQAWVAQLLYEEDDIRSFEAGCFPESLTDGRILCHLANRISPGCVERIHDDDSARSQAKNILSFVEACRSFGVPEMTLAKIRRSKPKDVALSLHVLSYVIRDTVPTFHGPLLGQSSTVTSSSTSTSTDDTRMIDAIEAAKGRDGRHALEQDKVSARVRQGFPDTAKAQQLGMGLESSPTLSLPANSYGPGSERCRGSLSPVGPARDTPESLTLQDMMLNRPLSLPARLQGTPYGSFASPRGATTTGHACITPASPMPWSRLPSMYSADSQSLLQQPRASTSMSATPDNELSTWLLKFNLRAFEVALVAIGVETVGDLRYVEEDDLTAIGMHGPQIRKFMQNRPPVKDDI